MILQKRRRRGFTLIELVMVILLLGILAAIAIPNFIDFRTDAKNAATRAALGTIRSSISIATAAISLKEDPASGTPDYPTVLEMQANAFDGSHPILTGTNILDPSEGIPDNPWTLKTVPDAEWSTVFDCDALTKTYVVSAPNFVDLGWCYKESNGQAWANSDRNGGAKGETENEF